MEEKKISIIVPVYNAEKYLDHCMKSLCSQSFSNIEILLVDDGSTDGSGGLCDRYAEETERVRVFHMENSGVSAARNKGIEEATGDYLSFVDADDWIMPDMLEHLVKLLENTGYDVAGCGFREVSDHGGSQEEQTELLAGREFIEKGILSSDTSCCNKLFRWNSEEKRYFDTSLSIGEDMLFLLRLAEDRKRYCRSSYQGYCYRMNETSAMKQEFKESYMDQIGCWQEAKRQIAETEPELTDRVTSVLMISIMLVAGKLALLPRRKRKQYEEKINYCREQMKECRKVQGAFRLLSAGYRLKSAVYMISPHLYLNLYHILKSFQALRR